MIQVRKTLLTLFFLITVPLFLGLLIAGATLIPHPTTWFSAEKEYCKKRNIFVSGDSVHTDIGFLWSDVKDDERINRFLPPGTEPDDSHVILFGWGERAFYLEVQEWDKLTLSIAMRALFHSPGSLMHIRLRSRSDTNAALVACTKRWEHVKESILEDFAQGDRIKGYGAHDWFYPARGSYSLLRTCNSWTVEKLRLAGLPTPMISQFATPVLWHLNRISIRN